MRPILLIAALLAASIPAAAGPDAAVSRKVGFIGCMARPDDAVVANQVSTSLEKRLLEDHLEGYEFLHDGVSRGRSRLSGGPVTAERIAAAGRVLGADKIVLCLITYERGEPADYLSGNRGYISLVAGYMIYDTASAKLEKRGTVAYRNDLESTWAAMASEQELFRAAVDNTVENLERALLAKLPQRAAASSAVAGNPAQPAAIH